MSNPDVTAELARQVRDLARKVTRLEREQRTQARASQARHRSVEGGGFSVYDEAGALRTVLGAQPDGTFTWTDHNGPVPPMPDPDGVTVTPLAGGIGVEWDGTFTGEEAAPLDFLRVEVHRDVTPGYEATDDTQRATMPSSAGGAVVLPVDDPDTVQRVKLVTVTTSLVESPATPEVAVAALPADGGSAPEPLAASPTPETVVGPAAVIVNYAPALGSVVDLYVWTPPDRAEGVTEWDTPPALTAAHLHTEGFPSGGFVYTDAEGNRLDPERPVWVALRARNGALPVPPASPWVDGQVGAIDPAYLTMLVGSLIAQKLQAETLTGVTITGSRLEILNAITAYENFLEVHANVLNASSAIFKDNVTRRGVNNYLEGRETASAGVADPSSPIGLTSYWPAVQLARTAGSTTKAIVAMSGNAELAVFGMGNIDVYSRTTGAKLRSPVAVVGEIDTWLAGTRLGDFYYVWLRAFMSSDYVLRRYCAITTHPTLTEGQLDTSWGPSSGVQIGLQKGDVSNEGGITMTEEGTHLVLLHTGYHGGLRYKRFNVSTRTQVEAWSTASGWTPAATTNLVGAHAELSAGYVSLWVQPEAATRVYLVNQGTGQSLVNSTVYPRQPRPYDKTLVGFSRSWTLDADMILYSHLPPESPVDPTDEWKYTWYDSDPAGAGTAESKPSPPRTASVIKPGALALVTVPQPPNDGTTDAPNTVRVYAKNSRQGAEFTPLELQNGRVIGVVDYSGAAPPTVSGFAARPSAVPGGYLAGKGDTFGPLWELIGNGRGRIGPLSWDANGVASFRDGATSTPAVQLVPTMTVASHGLFLKQIAPGVVGMSGFLDVDDNVTGRRSTGITIPAGMRPIAEAIASHPQTGASGSYRYIVTTSGAVDFEQTAGPNAPFESVSMVWFTA